MFDWALNTPLVLVIFFAFLYKKVACLFFAFIDNISLSITQPSNDAKRGKNRYMADSLALNQI